MTNAISTPLAGVLLIEPRVFADARGFFFESYNRRELTAAGVDQAFVQDNHSHSARNVLRGLHYQVVRPQGKLLRVVAGEVLDVAVDLRRSSPTFGRCTSIVLSAESKRILWLPPGLAHGFAVRSDSADFLYKTTDFRVPEHERTIAWDDPDLAIDWQLTQPPVLSEKDSRGTRLRNAEVYPVRILLTGRDGQIGWALQRCLAPLGAVVAPGRSELDLEDAAQLREAVRSSRPDVVLNAAAYSDVDQAEVGFERAMAVNGGAPGALAEEASRWRLFQDEGHRRTPKGT